MPFAVEVLEEDRLVLARLAGPFTVSEAHAALAAIKNRITAYPVEGVLLDLRGVEYTSTLDEAVDFLAEDFVSFLGRRRLAFVTVSPAHYGMARMISRRLESRGVEADVYADEHAALEWLHSSHAHDRHEVDASTESQRAEDQRRVGTSGREEPES